MLDLIIGDVSEIVKDDIVKVDDYLEDIQVPYFTWENVQELVEMRRKTFLGFASVEADNGFIKPSVSFSTSQGQEMLRIMLFRVLEEIIESSQSTSELHIQEELIDALNYFMSALMLDQKYFDVGRLSHLLFHAIEDQSIWAEPGFVAPPAVYSVFLMTELIAGSMAETFRNRAWQVQTQQSFFHGYENAANVYREFLNFVLSHFTGWEDFYRLFVAKDKVLQFRLESKY